MTTESAGRRPRVFFGMKPTGTLHIGNFLGAIRQWVARQDEKDNCLCVVDMHAITVPQDPDELRRGTRELAAVYIAAGLDPEGAPSSSRATCQRTLNAVGF